MTASPQPNTALQRFISNHGLMLDVVARSHCQQATINGDLDVRTTKSTVSNWCSGRRRPKGRTAEYLAEALGSLTGLVVTLEDIGYGSEQTQEPPTLAPDPIAATSDLGRALMDTSRRNFLQQAVYVSAALALPLHYDHEAVARTLRARQAGARIGRAEVAAVRQTIRAFRSADEQLGGGHGLAAATFYLTDAATPILRGRFSDETVRTDAYNAVAELAYLLAWKHHDLAQEGAAQRYYMLGYQLATEADYDGHSAWMLRALAHQALNLKKPDLTVDLAEESLRRSAGHVDSQTRALLLITSARAYGATKQGTKAAAALRAAEDALSNTGDPVADYALAVGPVAATISSHTGKTLSELGDHGGAERHRRTALAGRDPDEFRRIHALTMSELAGTLDKLGRMDEAVAAWNSSLDLMDGVSSARNTASIKSIGRTMARYQARGVRGSAALSEKARAVLLAA
ncbi:tetratricopeptide repeat protein [Kitasatospora sp. NPDC127111]|uniref:tetratricopeptide repeat protein n=1 Tax=Kitasatospora sp. NPDC127111 TaxID=3345363 RepID=UPI003636D215